MNRVIRGAKAQEIILNGAKTLYDAVKETYGPASGNVGILHEYGALTITHDGVTVAKNVNLEGDERVGAEVIKQVATKMDSRLGDGTTTVTILSYSILEEAQNRVLLGANVMKLQKEIQADLELALEGLPALSEQIDTEQSLAEVATISSGDKDLGSIVAKVVHSIGKDGVVTVEVGSGFNTESSIVEGFTFDRGFVSPYLVTDTARMEAVYENPSIYITSNKITQPEQLVPIFQKMDGKKELLIIGDVEGTALDALVLNKVKGLINAVVVNPPMFGNNRPEVLKDIAFLTDTQVVDDNQPLEKLGKAEKIVINQNQTTIINGAGDISQRLTELTTQLEKATSEYDKENLEKRRAALGGKVAVIKVGGETETEINEKKFRVDDAVFAAKAALDEGIVPGGATAYLELAKNLDDNSILKAALKVPFKVLLENSGLDEKSFTLEKQGEGVDVTTGEVVTLRDAGIIDPAKTVRTALKTAVSIAGTALTMKAIVVEVKKDD